ncbi:MAG: hypothetical protein GY820_20030, partial [Gammaproteobacteria bacterium]|nr:hypothetical protein [Gammaproteobacteria bacterium]
MKAKLLCSKLGMHLNRLNRRPDCTITFELFAKLAKCEIIVLDSNRQGKRREVLAHYYPPNLPAKREPCHLRVQGKNHIYSLLQSRNSFHQRFRKCRRCGDVTSRRVRDVARHAAFCSKFSVEQRRRGIGTELRFRHHKYQSQKTIIDKLRSLSINIGVEFSELKSACVFDCESYQTKLTSGGDKRMARYSDSFGFGSRQRLAMIV